MGIAVQTESTHHYHELIKQADEALYQSKATMNNTFTDKVNHCQVLLSHDLAQVLAIAKFLLTLG